MHFTFLYHNVITRNYRKSHRKSFTMFFCCCFGCQIRHKFVHQNLVCEFINTFSCHFECTKENTLILTPNVDNQGRLIRIATDENLWYIELLKIVFVYLFVWSLLSHSRFFIHMEKSSLPMKCCKFWSMLGTHGHWAVRVLIRDTPTVTRAYPF